MFLKKVTSILTNYDNRDSFASRLRTKRIGPLVEMVENLHRQNGSVNIIDIGGTDSYWNIMPMDFFEKYNINITVINLAGTFLNPDHGPFKFVEADACNLSLFDDKQFDIAHSNSVVEHVGDWGRMMLFARELERVSKNYFIQTPNYWFPIEPHFMTPFFHWLPKPLRVWLVMKFQLGNWNKAATVSEAISAVESARLLSRTMFQALFPGSTVLVERFLLMPKSLIAVRC